MDVYNRGKGSNDQIVVGFENGSLKFLNKLGKVEKSVEDAHKGSVIAVKWNHDGLSLATSG